MNKKSFGFVSVITKTYVIVAAIAFIVGGFFVFGNVAQAATLEVGPENTYLTIQSAVDAASPGDIINVAAGTYTEQLKVSKDNLTIFAVGGQSSIIQAPSEEFASVKRLVELSGNGITLDGFQIVGNGKSDLANFNGSYLGVRIEGYGITVQNNTIKDLLTGIQTTSLNPTNPNNILNNTISGVAVGISLQNDNNVVTGNNITANSTGFGIASFNTTFGNNIINITTTGGAAAEISGGADPYKGSIQDGINAVNAGDTVRVAAGEYVESLSLTKAVNLAGNGTSTTVIKPSIAGGAVITVDVITGPMTISGFTIDANNNANESGIYIEHGSSNITFEQNDVKNFTDRGIVINNSNGTTVRNNTLTGSSGDINAGIYVDNESENNSIDGNTIGLPTSGAGTLYGVLFAGPNSKSNTVENNTINGGARAFQQNINVSGVTTFSNNIIGNTTSPSYAGIEIDGGSAIISGNTIKNAVRPIEIQGAVDITINNNTIDGATYSGINLGAYSGAAGIQGNNIHGTVNGNGILAQAGGTSLNIVKNIIYGVTGRGIQLSPAAKNANIDGNEIYNVADYAAIIIEGDDSDGATGAKINNNYLHNNIVGGAAINAQTAEFNNNTIVDNGFGIEMGAAGAVFVLRNNTITGNNDPVGTICSTYGVCVSALSIYKGTADAANNYWGTSSSTEIAAKVTDGVVYAPWSGGLTSETNVNADAPEVIIGSNAPTSASTVDVPSDVTNATLNVSGLLDTGTMSATLPGAIAINATTSIGKIMVEIPAGIQITGAAGWAGVINVPQVKSNSTVTVVPSLGNTASVSSVIEVGFDDIKLTFDKAVRILIAGQSGKYVGYSRGGVFTAITNICSADTQVAGDNLPTEGDCKIDVGNDLVIWTKHFTSFATYTQSLIPVTPSTSYSGGGGGGGGSSAPTTITPVVTTPVVSAPVIVSPAAVSEIITEGQVLGASTFNFASDLRLGSKGDDVIELQNRLTAEGVYSGPITGYFGQLTFAGVKAYQAKYGISQVGNVGPLTRAQLNNSQVAGASTVNIEAIQAQIAVLQAQVDALLKQLQELKQQ
ncbi:MAG: right-handed parallel beta-helix repeat-containing protein [Candidatus Paceibacterota bacterium]